MSFGYSVGDFFVGANLTYQLIQALSKSKGASIEYQEAIMELGAMQQTFLQVSRMRVTDKLSQATINAASHIVLSSMKIIGDFLAKTERYREMLCGRGTGNTFSDSWQKMGWVLFKREELRMLKDSLQIKLSSISVLLASAHFDGEMPHEVAQYQDSNSAPQTHSNSPSKAYNSSFNPPNITITDRVNATSDEVSQPNGRKSADMNISHEKANVERNFDMDRRNASSTIGHSDVFMDRDVSTLELERTIDNIQSASTPKLELTTDTNPWNHKPALLAIIPSSAFDSSTPDHPKEPSLEEGFHAKEPEHSDTNVCSDVPKASSNNYQQRVPGKSSEALARIGQFLKIRTWNESQEAKIVAEIDKLLLWISVSDIEDSKPIAFKDAVGRKFTFPWKICRTWQGMEEMIKQAFLHIDVIGPHVQEGHYDLIANGGIILPQTWDSMIAPGDAVTMHMWPLPAQPQRDPPPFPTPPPRRNAQKSNISDSDADFISDADTDDTETEGVGRKKLRSGLGLRRWITGNSLIAAKKWRS